MQGRGHKLFVCVKVLLFLLLLQINLKNSVKAISNINVCTQEGSTLNHECTVMDTSGFGLTVWQGETFKCSESFNQISLAHSQYESGVSGVCGNFSAVSVGISGSEYTSRLTIPGFSEVTINCTLSGAVVVETIFVRFGTFPSPPDGLTVTLFPESSLNVSWSPPTGPVEGGVGGYVFGVTGEGCGCVSVNVSGDTTSVTCSGWTAAGQTCSFEVRTLSQDCGLASNPVSSAIRLLVPSAPQNLVVEPIYKVSGEIQEINVNFSAVDAPFIGTHISQTVNYLVSFIGLTITHQFTNVSCGFNNYCGFVVNSFDLSYEERYLITVKASTMIGSGSTAIFPIQIVTNIVEADIVMIIVDITTSTVYCLLLGSFVDTPDAVCSITYGYPQGNCEKYTDSSVTTTGRPGVNLTISLSQDVNTGADFCYTVSVKYGLTTIKIIGNFTSECDPNVLGSSPSSQRSAGSVSVNNGEIVYDGVTSGSTAHLVCDKGYAASEETRDRVCLCNGVWSGKTQICEETVLHASECDPGVLGFNPSSQQSAGSVTVNNGEIVYDGLTPGSTAHLVCNEGYTSSEATRDRNCLNNGEWSEKTQICEEINLELAKNCATDVTISTVATFLLTLSLGIFIGVINVLGWKKYCGKPEKAASQTYEDTLSSNVLTENNPSYSLKQHTESTIHNRDCESQLQHESLTEHKPCPVYEDPDNFLPHEK